MMKSLFDLLEEDSSQKLISAVFMTYGFEADLFERNVLPSIFRLDIMGISFTGSQIKIQIIFRS